MQPERNGRKPEWNRPYPRETSKRRGSQAGLLFSTPPLIHFPPRVSSIRALSQPASYPRHGPLGRRRRWKARSSTGAIRRCHAVSPLATTRPVTYDPGAPVVPGEVSLAAGGAGATCETWPGLNKDPLACLFAQPHGHRAGLGGTPLMEMPG
jgi:hypothetical protein